MEKVKILAIDDNADNIVVLKALINEAFPNSTLFTAMDGIKGIELAAANDPDVILLDIVMPEMDGFEVCQKLKADKKLRDIPVVFTAIKGDKESRIRALEAGAEAFLAKPIDEIELIAQIRAMVKIKTANEFKRNEKERLTLLVAARTSELEQSQKATLKLLDDLKAENEARKLSEEAQNESEEKYRTLLEFAPDAFFQGDSSGNFITANDKAVEFTGYLRSELLSMNMSDLFPNEVLINTPLIYDLLKLGDTFKTEREITGKNGERLYVEMNSTAMSDGTFQCFMRDITERKQAEELIRKSEEKYRNVFENVQDIYFETSMEGTILEVSPSIELISKGQYHRDDLIGQSIYELYINPEERNVFVSLLIERGNVNDSEVTFKNKDGSLIYCSISSKLVYDAQGKPEKIIGSLRDITMRKRSEEAQRESAQLFRGLFNASPDAIILIDPHDPDVSWPIKDCNKAACQMNGYTHGELVGHTIDIINTTVATSEERTTYFDNLRQKGTLHVETYHRHKEGHIFPIECLTSIVTLGGHEFVLGIDRDITERKKVEEELKKSFSLLNATLESTADGILVVDKNGKVAGFNKKFVQFWRIPESIIATQSDERLIAYMLDQLKEPDQFLKKVMELYANEEETSSDILEFKDGRIFDRFSQSQKLDGKIVGRVWSFRDITESKKAEELIRETEERFRMVFENVFDGIVIYEEYPDLSQRKLIDCNEQYAAMAGLTREELLKYESTNDIQISLEESSNDTRLESLSTRKAFRGSYTWIRPDGKDNVIEFIGVPVMWRGKSYTIGIDRDITESKKSEAELIAAKEKAEESDRLKSAFLANMSHEIRTPLNSIIGFSELLLDSDFGPDQHEEFIRMIGASGNNLLAIINDIMDLSRIESGLVSLTICVFSVHKFIGDIQKQYSFKAAEKEIEFRLDPSNPGEDIYLESDEPKLKQIMINLVGNAIKFTAKGFIEVGFRIKGNLVEFHVKDSGIGIPTEYHKKIFERFRQVDSSNTRKYGGNGLGLAISKSLVELLGGEIGMESEKGEGSTFYFTIPIRAK